LIKNPPGPPACVQGRGGGPANPPNSQYIADQFGLPLADTEAPADVAWSANAGTIGASGRYTAPNTPRWVTITATANGLSGSATVYVASAEAGSHTLLAAASRKADACGRVADLSLPGRARLPSSRGGAGRRPCGSLSAMTSPRPTARSARMIHHRWRLLQRRQVDGKLLTVELLDAPDARVVSVRLAGIVCAEGSPLEGDTDAQVRALYGDADRDGVVTSNDLLALRSRLGRRPSAADLLNDFDRSGSVTAADLVACLRRLGPRVS
jgi:hypothetical protein